MYLFIPSNENGVIVDPNVAANFSALARADSLREIFIFSHGWWTSAIDAMISYNQFLAGMASVIRFAPGTLAVGIHWPSMISENSCDWLNLAESASFFTMEQRAEQVGRHGVCNLLRVLCQIMQGASGARIHLIGHSFGCKVICAALDELLKQNALELPADFDLTLLQAAIEDDALGPGGRYEKLATLSSLRMLVTKSSEDVALRVHFKRAHAAEFFDKEDRTALGTEGPSATTISAWGGTGEFVLPSSEVGANTSSAHRLCVADLSEMHRMRSAAGLYKPRPFAGQHSDIYFAEIYRMIGRFVGTQDRDCALT